VTVTAATISSQPGVDEQNPWPGLSAFDESAQRFFNGRRVESAALRRLVQQGSLTVLFGASGLGKTSLVQAGLFPLLRRDVLPVYVRLDFSAQALPLIEQVKARLATEVQRCRIDAPASRAGETLWEFLHRPGLEFWSDQNQLLTPLFVFDQFVVVFSLGAANGAAVERLRIDLADLIENRVPADHAARLREDETGGLALDAQRYKILLSFREDFLPSMEGWKQDIPSIMRNRLRLLPMAAAQALEAVHTTAPHLAPEPIARDIVQFVAAAGEANVSAEEPAIEPALLSLVCHGLNERRKQQGKSQFDRELLTGTGQAIISDFYSTAVAGMPDRVQRFIERELITERGFRKPCDVDDARSVHGVTDAELALLVDRRLLRIEPARGTERVELTHDLLTRVVREARNRQREKDRIAREGRARRRLLLTGTVFAVIAIAMGVLSFYAWTKAAAADRAKEVADRAKAAAEEAQKRAEGDRDAATKATEALKQSNAKVVESLGIATAAQKQAERQARAALGHQLAGAALAAVKDQNEKQAITYALGAIDATRPDGVVLADAEDALRRALASERPELERSGHVTEIRRIAVSPDGRRVITFGEDHTAIWDIGLQEEIRRFDRCAAVSADWKRLACGDMYRFEVVELETGKVLAGLSPVRGRQFFHFVFGERDTQIAAGNDVETFFVDGRAAKPFEGRPAAISRDGKVLVTIVAADSVRMWDLEAAREAHRWSGNADEVRFDPSGSRLAVLTGGTSKDATLTVTPRRALLWDFTTDRTTPIATPQESDLRCLDFTPDGSRIGAVTASRGEGADAVWRATGRLFDARSGAELLAWESAIAPPFVVECRFTPDGTTMIVTGSKDRSTDKDAAEGKGEIWNLGSTPPRLTHSVAGTRVAFDPRGEIVATADGASAAAGTVGGKTQSRFPARTDAPALAAVFTRDGRRVAISSDDRRIRIWDAATGKRLVTLIGLEAPAWNLAFSWDGTRLVTGSSAGHVRVWNAGTGQLVRELPRFRNRLLAVAFSADGARVIVSGYNDRVAIFDVASGTEVPTALPAKPSANVFGLGYSGDGRRLGLVGRTVTLFDAASLRPVQEIAGDAGTPNGGLYLNRDATTIAAAGINGVMLWTRAHGWRFLKGSADGNSALPYQLAFSRDGRKLITPGVDNTIRVWDTATASATATFYYEAPAQLRIKAVGFSEDEREIQAVGSDWSLHRFPVSLDALVAIAKKRVAGE
jgi:WD40 repeat protein